MTDPGETHARIRAAFGYSGKKNNELEKLLGLKSSKIGRLTGTAGPSAKKHIHLEELHAIADLCGVPREFMEHGFEPLAEAVQALAAAGAAVAEAEAAVETAAEAEAAAQTATRTAESEAAEAKAAAIGDELLEAIGALRNEIATIADDLRPLTGQTLRHADGPAPPPPVRPRRADLSTSPEGQTG